MIGVTSRTISPSSVVSSRSTPCVAGWCGPMLIVNSSVVGSISVPYTGESGSSSRSSVTDCSRARYGTPSGSFFPARGSFVGVPSVIPARHLVLVVREDHGLAAHREVAPLGESLVVLRHQDAAVVRMAVELDAEHVPDLALLEVGGREQVDDRRERRGVDPDARLHVEALD